jgi:hypothetical protein
MATFPLATCARMLGIHPKTLHHWLKEANLPLAAHPTDARIKCVVEEHLLEVAKRHGRPLPLFPLLPGFMDALRLTYERSKHHPRPQARQSPIILPLRCLLPVRLRWT